LGNAANPVRFRGAIDPRLACGVNRRSGEKPQGRNASGRLAAIWPKGGGNVIWEWTHEEHVGGGEHYENEFQERRTGLYRFSVTEGALKAASSP